MNIPNIGDPFRFVPSAFFGETSGSAPEWKRDIPRAVTGRVIFIHLAHRFFTVAFTVNGVRLTESFKF